MTKVLWLDDLRDPTQALFKVWIVAVFGEDIDVTWVKSYNEFIAYLTDNNMPDGIMFDHDLADTHYTPEHLWDDYEESKKWQDAQIHTEKTGLDCAKWLVEYCMNNAVRLPKYFVHSQNPVGRDNIQGYLDNYLKFQEPS